MIAKPYKNFAQLAEETQMQYDNLSDYEKAILLYAHIVGTTFVRRSDGARIPAPVHRAASAKLERLGAFSDTKGIALSASAAAWVNANHRSIGHGYTA